MRRREAMLRFWRMRIYNKRRAARLRKSDFYFELPEELIAQDPLKERSGSRLLMLNKSDGSMEHHIFKEIVDYLRPGDCLVLNNTKV